MKPWPFFSFSIFHISIIRSKKTKKNRCDLKNINYNKVNINFLYPVSTGWVYYCPSNAMQYSNTAPETTALVMHDSNTFFLWLCEFQKHTRHIINIINMISKMQ